jgi:hypothetical protein
MKVPLSSTAVRISSGVSRVEAPVPACGMRNRRRIACTNRFANQATGVAGQVRNFRIALDSSATGSGYVAPITLGVTSENTRIVNAITAVAIARVQWRLPK